MASTATASALRVPATAIRAVVPIVAVVAVEPTCVCGQALECSHQAHCPRCGVAIS